jgi:hypothetical protein
MGCTDCGRKGGCDSRKHGMFAAVDEALARLYPTRRWGERDEDAALEAGFTGEEGEDLARALATRMGTSTLYRPGDDHEWCDYVYVLCLGRTPSIVEIREGRAGARADAASETDGDVVLDERYLRIALSGLARFAGVQEVAMSLERRGDSEAVVITERARSGVFDPILLPRFQALVAVLAERDIRHLDFGEIVEAPADFDAADYASRFGGAPVIANYLFYPQPPTTVGTVVLDTRQQATVSSSA